MRRGCLVTDVLGQPVVHIFFLFLGFSALEDGTDRRVEASKVD